MLGQNLLVFTVSQLIEGLVIEGIVLIPVGPANQILSIDTIQPKVLLHQLHRDSAAIVFNQFYLPIRLFKYPLSRFGNKPPHPWQVFAIEQSLHQRLLPIVQRIVIVCHQVAVVRPGDSHLGLIQIDGENFRHRQQIAYIGKVSHQHTGWGLQNGTLLTQLFKEC